MSLGIHRKHFLTAAERLRIQKTIEQEERPGNEIILLSELNPFGTYGVLSSTRNIQDSAGGSAFLDVHLKPVLKAKPSEEFRFSSSDAFTLESWIKPVGDQYGFHISLNEYATNFEPEFDSAGLSNGEYGPGYLDWPNNQNGYTFFIGGSFRADSSGNGFDTIYFTSASPNIKEVDSALEYYNDGTRSLWAHALEYTSTFLDSAGDEDHFVNFNQWNHIAAVHEPGIGLSLYVNGIRLAGPQIVNIRRTQNAYGLHFGANAPIVGVVGGSNRIPEYDYAGPAFGIGEPGVSNPRFAVHRWSDFSGFNNNEMYVSQTRISRVARYSGASFTVPGKHTSDNDTVLLLDFDYNTRDEILDIIAATSVRERKTLTIQNTVDRTKGDSAGYPYSPERTITVSESPTYPVGGSQNTPQFEPDSAGQDPYDDPTTRANMLVYVDTKIIESGDWKSLAPYMTITGTSINDFNFTHDDPWTFDWMYPFPYQTTNTSSQANYRGFMMSDPDTHNGWGFTFNEFEFHWWSNDPTNSHLQVYYWNTGKDSADDHWSRGRFDPDPSVGYPDSYRMRYAEHIAVVNVPGEGVSLYAYNSDSEGQGHRVAGPFPIHITPNNTTQTVYWGGIEKLTPRSTQIWDSAGNAGVWSSAGTEPNNLPSTYTLRDTSNDVAEDVGWGTRHGRTTVGIYEVRVSNTARYTGDTYQHPGHRFYNDPNTIFLCHPIPTRLDSGGDWASGNTYANGEVRQDSGVVLGGDDNGEDI